VGGDIILSVESVPVGQADDHDRIRDILTKKSPGVPFSMKILRSGKVVELTGKAP
jgi:S1-C subfamily serine protease